jgi:hypothetical protein
MIGRLRKNKTLWPLYLCFALWINAVFFEGLFYWEGIQSNPATVFAFGLLSCYLLAIWINADSKRNSKMHRPSDYGFFVYYGLPVYLPYYLWRTRGTRGIGIFVICVLAVASLGSLIKLAIYHLELMHLLPVYNPA